MTSHYEFIKSGRSIEIGTPVYVFGNYGRGAKGTIVKITPKGFFDVKYDHMDVTRRFNAVGHEVSGNRYNRHYLNFAVDVVERNAANEVRRIEIVKVLDELSSLQQPRHTWSLESMESYLKKVREITARAESAIKVAKEAS